MLYYISGPHNQYIWIDMDLIYIVPLGSQAMNNLKIGLLNLFEGCSGDLGRPSKRFSGKDLVRKQFSNRMAHDSKFEYGVYLGFAAEVYKRDQQISSRPGWAHRVLGANQAHMAHQAAGPKRFSGNNLGTKQFSNRVGGTSISPRECISLQRCTLIASEGPFWRSELPYKYKKP